MEMAKYVARPKVGAFLPGEPDAIKHLQGLLDAHGLIQSSTVIKGGTSYSTNRMDLEGIVYGVSINGKMPIILEVKEV